MNRMKIMVLVDTYFPLQDGVQTATQHIAEGLAKKHEVLVLTSLRAGMERLDNRCGVRIERIKARRNPYTMQMVGEKRALKARIYSFSPDVLIVVGIQNWGFDWLKKHLKNYPGRKILYTHGASCLEEYDVKRLIGTFHFRRQILADLLKIYQEGYWQRYKTELPEYMGKFDRITYLYENDDLYLYMRKYQLNNEMLLENSVDDIFFNRKAFLVEKDKPVVFINVSSYTERKNQRLILKAFYEAEVPGSKLILIGSKETDYYRELLEYYKSLKEEYPPLGREVRILCGLDRKEILDIYQEADIYVAASSWEAMSISICEAAAAGLTILSTDTGHVSGIPGVMLCKNEREFIENMKLLSISPAMRSEKGKMAYEYALEHYLIQNKVDNLEKTLIELIDEAG